MQTRAASKAAKAEAQRVVAQNVAQAMSSVRLDAPERAKRNAKAKIAEIGKRVQLLRKLFAGDPKAMARALAQVFKELRAAVKAYKDAGGAELGLAGETAGRAVANDTEPKADPDANDGKAGEPSQAGQAPSAAAQGAAIYDAVLGGLRKAIGEDGLDFIRTVRDLVSGAAGLRDMLEAARTQAKGGKPDKATDEAFEDADKAMRSLADDLAKMERELRQAAPEAGMTLSVDA